MGFLSAWTIELKPDGKGRGVQPLFEAAVIKNLAAGGAGGADQPANLVRRKARLDGSQSLSAFHFGGRLIDVWRRFGR